MAWNPTKNVANQAQRALMRAQAHGILGQALAGLNGAEAGAGAVARPMTEMERQAHVEGRLWDEMAAIQAIPANQRTPAQKKRLANLNVAVSKEGERSLRYILAEHAARERAKNPTGVLGHGQEAAFPVNLANVEVTKYNSNMNSRRRNTRKRKSRRATTRRNRRTRK